jgi:hypothetical protein
MDVTTGASAAATAASPKLYTRRQLAEFLQGLGYPVSLSRLNKACAPAINTGPQPATWFGRRPLYTAESGIAWVHAHLGTSCGGPIVVAQGDHPSQQRKAEASQQKEAAHV